jgi:serine/threonine-protein kinase RIO1
MNNTGVILVSIISRLYFVQLTCACTDPKEATVYHAVVCVRCPELTSCFIRNAGEMNRAGTESICVKVV